MSADTSSRDTARPSEIHERIDRVCLAFEDHWQAGKRPRIEDSLEGWDGTGRALLLKELLLLELEYLREGGGHPTADEYLERFPTDRSIVGDMFGLPVEEPDEELLPGQLVGRYVIERLLGRGSFGWVYLAWDSELERHVALKSPRVTRGRAGPSLEEFIEEARTASKIDHPAIVPVLDIVRDRHGTPVIVMPFIDGCSLRDRIVEARLSRDDAVRLIIEVAEAIDFAHRRGFVHRDLKPRNILLDSDESPHISDFGLALHESTQRARAGESAGSLAYMSPEQLRGEAHWLDGRSDIWSLGVILYEMLAGRRPFGGQTADEVESEIFARDPKPLRQIDAEIPIELERICLMCLAKSVGSRFATAGDLADALRQFRRATQPAAAPDAHGRPEKRAASGRWLSFLVGGALGVGALGLAVAALFMLNPTSPRGPVPALDNIELSVWGPRDDLRGRISRNEHTASPLRQGDKVRLTLRAHRPTYLYVLWIGVDGDVSPLHPWRDGQWNRPSSDTPIAELRIPEQPDQSWEVQTGPAGVETLLVFVAEQPIPADVDLSTAIQVTRPQLNRSLDQPLWFENGQLDAARQSATRSPNFGRPVSLNDPLITNQLKLAEAFRKYCSSFYALCFPISES